MQPEEEILDLFDINEQVVGTVKRAEYYKKPEVCERYYLRSAEMFIRNDKGQLWVPHRNSNKEIAPSGLDYSAGGHVGAGEDYVIGCLREIEEELNLTLQPDDLQFVAKFTPSGGDRWFRTLFIYESNDTPVYNTDDFSEYYWMTCEELLQKLKAGELAKESMLETVKTLGQWHA